MKIIDGRVSLLVSGESTTLEVYDKNAASMIIKVEFTPEEFCSMLGRVAMVAADVKVYDLTKVGKSHQHKSFEFEILESMANQKNAEILSSIAQAHLDEEGEGWIADKYFGAKNSFFKKDGVQFARVVARRWV